MNLGCETASVTVPAFQQMCETFRVCSNCDPVCSTLKGPDHWFSANFTVSIFRSWCMCILPAYLRKMHYIGNFWQNSFLHHLDFSIRLLMTNKQGDLIQITWKKSTHFYLDIHLYSMDDTITNQPCSHTNLDYGNSQKCIK